MAHDLGLPGPAAAYRLEASHLRAAINTYLYDPGRHLYVNSDLQPLTVPQDGNALAVLYGVAPAGQAPAILAALRRVLPITPYGPLPFTTGAGYRVAVSPYTTDEEVQADFAVGDAPAALGLLATLWGHMDASGPDFSGADWEVVGADGTPGFGPYTSLAHGWSSGPTSALTTYVLGVQPTAPGFRTWLVAPQPGGLTWAEGQVPTPEGRLTVRWAQRPATGQFALQVRAPGHTSGTVTVPVPPSGATVTVRNAENRTRTLVTRTTGTSTASFRLAGGRTYRISVTPRQG